MVNFRDDPAFQMPKDKIADDQGDIDIEELQPVLDIPSALDLSKRGLAYLANPSRRIPALIAADVVSSIIPKATKEAVSETLKKPLFPGLSNKLRESLGFEPQYVTNADGSVSLKMSQVGGEGSSVASKSDEAKKIYPNLKYKTAADDFIKENYMKMSDEQMLKEMMKDSDKYFYEIPSSVKSLEQTRLGRLGLSRGYSKAAAMRYGSELDYENVMKEFDTMTKDMDLSKMSQKQIYEFFENAYKSATGLEPLTSGNTKKLFLNKIDRFAKERGFEKLRRSKFIQKQDPDKALFKKYLFQNKVIDDVASNNKNIDKTSLSRYLDFIRVSSPNSKKGIDGNFDNFMIDFDLEIKDLKNIDSIFYKQYEYFKKFDKVRDEAGKKIKPFLNKIFPSPSDIAPRNSLQIAHRFENTQIGKTVEKGLAGTGGTPSAYYLDISRFNSEIQPKLESQIRKALANGDTVALNKLNTQLTDRLGAEIIIDGVKFGKHTTIEEKLLKLIKKYESNPALMRKDGVTRAMINNVYKGLDIISKGAENLGIRTMKEGGEVKKFKTGGPNFVDDPAFDMPNNEGFEMSDLTQFVPPQWRGIGEGAKKGIDYLKEKFVDRPMELDYEQKETKTATVLNTIEQMGYDISPFYGVLRANKMFNEDTARGLEEYMTGEYGEMGKSALMAAFAALGMIPVIGTEARAVRGAIGQTKNAIRPKVGGTTKITSKEDVIEPGLVEEPGSVVMQDGKPMVVDADGNYKPMPVFESKLEKSLNLEGAPQSATTDQWLEYFRKNGVNERELAEAGILDELNRAKTFERATPNEQLRSMYEESASRNLNIIEKTEGGRGDAKAKHMHAGSDNTGFDKSGENYHEVVFQSGTVKGDPEAFVSSGHYKEPNVLAFTRNKDYTTADNINVTAIQEWQTDLGAQAFKQQKELMKTLKGLTTEERVGLPTTVYRPFPVPDAGLKILIDEINAIDNELATLLPKKVTPTVDVAPGAVISKMYNQETRGVSPVFKAEPEDTTKMIDLMNRQQKVIDEMMKMDTVRTYLKQMENMGIDTTFPNVPFKNELDLMRMTIKANARMAKENGKQGLIIANADIVNGRWNKDLVKKRYSAMTEGGQTVMFDTKEQAIAWKDANNPQGSIKTVIDEKSSGYKFFQLYDQKIPQVMNEIAKEMGSTVVMKEINVGRNQTPFVVKNAQGDIVDSFRSIGAATDAYPQARVSATIGEDYTVNIPPTTTDVPATLTNLYIDVVPEKTQQVFMLELNDNFLYPQAIYKKYGGLVESSLKSINAITRPL